MLSKLPSSLRLNGYIPIFYAYVNRPNVVLMIVCIIGLVVLPSTIWLFGVMLWWLTQRESKCERKDVGVSVVVVARNEETTIRRCLESIVNQSVQAKEIVLIDDSSSDETYTIATEVAKKHRTIRIESLQAEAKVSPKKEALLQAFGTIDGDYVALTDADCEVPSKWIEALVSAFDESTGAVIGASWPSNSTTLADRFYRWERLIANTLMASACGWRRPASACGHNLLFSREALQDVDAPVHRDLPSGDDDLTVQAIARAGFKVKFCGDPTSVVTDLGGVRGSRWSQAARHQSVTPFYPFYWRIMFALTITCNILVLLILPAVFFFQVSSNLLGGVILKTLFDACSACLIRRQLRLDIPFTEIALASLLVPFWAIWRGLAASVGRSYDWRGRKVTLNFAGL